MRILLVAFIGGIVGTVFTSMIVLAWAGPTSAPPAGNVAAPLNVGGVDQVKNAGLALNSLAVFGNQILSGASRYINFGTTAGSGGYGIRDNGGMLEFKNSDGDWRSVLSASSTAPDWSNPKSYGAGGFSNQIVTTGPHKLCVLSASGDSGCGRCIVYRNADASWSVDSASCSGRSYNWCSATCFD